MFDESRKKGAGVQTPLEWQRLSRKLPLLSKSARTVVSRVILRVSSCRDVRVACLWSIAARTARRSTGKTAIRSFALHPLVGSPFRIRLLRHDKEMSARSAGVKCLLRLCHGCLVSMYSILSVWQICVALGLRSYAPYAGHRCHQLNR